MPEKILALGEVLWDLLPSGKQLGGHPPTSRSSADASAPMHASSPGSAAMTLDARSSTASGRWASRPTRCRSTPPGRPAPSL